VVSNPLQRGQGEQVLAGNRQMAQRWLERGRLAKRRALGRGKTGMAKYFEDARSVVRGEADPMNQPAMNNALEAGTPSTGNLKIRNCTGGTVNPSKGTNHDGWQGNRVTNRSSIAEIKKPAREAPAAAVRPTNRRNRGGLGGWAC